MRPHVSRRIGWAATVIVVLLAAAQFVRPSRLNPPENPALRLGAPQLQPAAGAVLDRACADCHSNRTRWPWYSNVEPFSFLLIHDVREGRGDLNLSDWQSYPTARQQKLLGRICQEVREGDMPPFQYTLVHREARLSAQDVDSLCRWTQLALQAASAGAEGRSGVKTGRPDARPAP